MNIRGIAVLALLFGGILAIVVPVYLSQTTAEPLPALPAEAAWMVRYDMVLDGEIAGQIGSLHLRLSVRNNRVHGVPLSSAKDDPYADHRLTGEFTAGKVDILFLRQDGPANYVSYYTARRVNEGRFVGTWIDNRGGSGDFDLVHQK